MSERTYSQTHACPYCGLSHCSPGRVELPTCEHPVNGGVCGAPMSRHRSATDRWCATHSTWRAARERRRLASAKADVGLDILSPPAVTS